MSKSYQKMLEKNKNFLDFFSCWKQAKEKVCKILKTGILLEVHFEKLKIKTREEKERFLYAFIGMLLFEWEQKRFGDGMPNSAFSYWSTWAFTKGKKDKTFRSVFASERKDVCVFLSEKQAELLSKREEGLEGFGFDASLQDNPRMGQKVFRVFFNLGFLVPGSVEEMKKVSASFTAKMVLRELRNGMVRFGIGGIIKEGCGITMPIVEMGLDELARRDLVVGFEESFMGKVEMWSTEMVMRDEERLREMKELAEYWDGGDGEE